MQSPLSSLRPSLQPGRGKFKTGAMARRKKTVNIKTWWQSNSQQRQLFADWITCSWRRMLALLGRFACALIWIALALSLTGCAHNSSSPCTEQRLPPAPALSESIPPESYSLRAQRSFKTWQEKLIDTPVMSKP